MILVLLKSSWGMSVMQLCHEDGGADDVGLEHCGDTKRRELVDRGTALAVCIA